MSPVSADEAWAADEMKWDEDKRLPGGKSVLLAAAA
jgi:hypothetical protein